MKRNDLHKYQLRLVDFIKKNKKSMLIVEMGLGKTATTLTALNDLFSEGLIKRCLIVAPLTVAKNVWSSELKLWEHIDNININVLAGKTKKNKNIELITSKCNTFVINFDVLDFIHDSIQTGQIEPFDCVIIDESSMIKDPRTLRFNYIKRITESAEYIVCLTGTPMSSGIKNLWGQIFVLDRGLRLGNKYDSFVNDYHTKSDYNKHVIKEKSGSIEIVSDKIKDITISMQAKDYLELPEKIIIDKYIDLDVKSRKVYDKLERDLVIELMEATIVTPNILALANKLMQLCNGFMYTEDRSVINFNSNKLDIIDEILETNENDNILLFYNYIADFDRIKNRFPYARSIKDNGVIDSWNNNEIRLLLAHPKSAGHGLNLQRGGNNIIWLSLTYSLENYLQANARLHRQGQSKPVNVIRLLTNDTIENKVKSKLDNKDRDQKDLITFLKQSYNLLDNII